MKTFLSTVLLLAPAAFAQGADPETRYYLVNGEVVAKLETRLNGHDAELAALRAEKVLRDAQIAQLSADLKALQKQVSGDVAYFEAKAREAGVSIPAPAPSVAVPASSPVLNVADSGGPHWTFPGDVHSHLVREHGFRPEQLAGLTRGQLMSLHDAAHEGRLASVLRPVATTTTTMTTTASPAVGYKAESSYSYSSCPGGVCPTGGASYRTGPIRRMLGW